MNEQEIALSADPHQITLIDGGGGGGPSSRCFMLKGVAGWSSARGKQGASWTETQKGEDLGVWTVHLVRSFF